MVGAPVPALDVRPLRPEEAWHVVAYFHDASDADLDRMGVPRAALPDPAAWEASLRATLAAPDASSFYLAWLVDGVPVGHAAIKDIRRGVDASMHLHMWSVPHRGRGHGATLFCRSALDAYERFGLRRLVCEPKADNPMPNRMLAKVGFPLLGSRVGRSSELSAVTALNRYDVRREVAAAFLQGAPPAPRPRP